ncbi:MAG: hypothetical protein DIZ80_13475 [endosymbiont of Galathealinum brachiosum]|uniref:LysM domain-containing protein n=1 Tax=endosymbiont of Galathealinum brachiosum TaxID=2200906 RepID=A0A370D884_9GAMM|nr:MAG: hypothetical protein DIZ80_13475 [endosymbiont of Galathealinum brachiosum]
MRTEIFQGRKYLYPEILMYKTINTKYLISLLLISSLFTTELYAGISNGTHWIIKPGDSLYKIARTVFPDSAKQQAKLRKELVSQNPIAFKNGAGNISVGDKLQLPDFAIKQNKPAIKVAPVVAAKKIPATNNTTSKPIIKNVTTAAPVDKLQTTTDQLITPDPADIIGKVIINVGDLNAQNRGAMRKLNRRSSIYKGDTISTGGKSLTQIRLKDGALLSLRPHTEIKIAEFRYNGREDGSEQSILELLKGGFRTITGVIGHRNKQNYQVRTSVATIGIRGTHYSLVLCQQSSCSDGDNNVDDGLYGGVADGSIVIENQTGIHQFNNDQFFKLTSSSAIPVEFLTPPSVFTLKNNGGKFASLKKSKHIPSKDVNARARRLAVIIQPNQLDPVKPPKPLIGDLNTPPVAEFQPDLAPDGAGMLLAFNQSTINTAITGTSASVIIAPNNNNQIILGPNRTPVAGREISANETGELVNHELVMTSPEGSFATLVPSSIGGSAALGVNWGRWNGDFILLENGARVPTKDNFHYIYTENLTTPTQLANLGGIKGASVTYTAVDGTLPTNHLGDVGSNLATINMGADFIAQEITFYDVDTSITTSNGTAFFQAGIISPVAFQDLSRDFAITGTSCDNGSGCTGTANVLFVGSEAAGAITSYQIHDDNGQGGISGTALLAEGQGQTPIQ